mgnify:CR=1 FL=1
MVEFIISICAVIFLFNRFRQMKLIDYNFLSCFIIIIVNWLSYKGYDNHFLSISGFFVIFDIFISTLGVFQILLKTSVSFKNIYFIIQHKFNYCLPDIICIGKNKDKRNEIIKQILNKEYKIVDWSILKVCYYNNTI